MAGPVDISVRLFGRPALVIGGIPTEIPSGKGSAVLLYLAFHGGWVGREELVYLLWPDTPEGRARGNLRPLLWRLGRGPFGPGLERERSRVRWVTPSDLQQYRRAVDERRWHDAWLLGRHELLAGFTLSDAPEFDTWLRSERAELQVSVRAAGVRALDALAATADQGAVMLIAAQLQRSDPLDEDLARRYLAALGRCGARSTALAVFDVFRRALAEEVGAEPEAATEEVMVAIRLEGGSGPPPGGAATAVQPPRAPRAPRAAEAMPIQPSRFIGRHADVTTVTERLLDGASSLVTIVGPGGVGKTRLAIEVASGLAARFRHGARFVDLTPATAASVSSSVALAIGMAQGEGEGETPARSIATYLRNMEMLLVLDNLEHLVDGGLEVVSDVLATAAFVKILATSRVRLGSKSERIYELAGMSHAPSDSGGIADAVQLFLQAARRVRPETGSADDIRSIVSICAHVGGLPLALELAASWLRVLTLPEIERELAHGLDVLEESGRGVRARHAGMRAVFAHSWSLLGGREQRALRDLSVFRGGWTREAAREVADVGMPLLLALTDASFIRRDGTGRFVRHPLVAQYTRERAEEDPLTRDAIGSRHAESFLRLITDRQGAWRTHEGARLLREIDDEMPNVEAAWRFAVVRRDEHALTIAMNGIRSLMITSSNKIELLVDLARQPLAWAEPTSALYARALVCLGVAEVWRGVADVAEGAAHLEEGLSVLERLDLHDDVAQACRFLGMARARQGRIDEARGHWERALRLSRELGDAEGEAMMFNNLGDSAPILDDAITSYRRAIALALEHDQPFPAAMAFDGLGCTLFRRSGASEEVCMVIARAIDLWERTGLHHVAQPKRILLAHVLAASGRLQEAHDAIDDALRNAPQPDDDEARGRVDARAVAAWIAYLRGDVEGAAAACDDVLLRSGDRLSARSEVLARTVAGRLALAASDLVRAASEFACARTRTASVAEFEARSSSWHDLMAEVPEAASWTRLLAAEIDLAIADDRLADARALAGEALTIALSSEQQPSGAVALVATAHVLDRGGDVAGARALVSFVRGHAAAPYEALQSAHRLEVEWLRRPDVEAMEPTALVASEMSMEALLARMRMRLEEP